MSLLEKIKGLFSRTPLPKETELLLSGVADVAELRKGLDEIVTRNEVEARDIEREIEKLAKMEAGHKKRIAAGGDEFTKREKMATLREIQRLRRRMTSLEKRHRIHQDNIDLHLGLFDRITEMEAMELKKITQGQIEEIAVDYEEKLEKHRDIMAAAKAATGIDFYEDSAEEFELAKLEAEILKEAGVAPEPEEAVKEEPAKEPAAKEKPADVKAKPADPDPARRPLDQELDLLEEIREREEEHESAPLELE